MYQDCIVLTQKEICPEIFQLELDVKDIAAVSMPGQFVMISGWESSEPFLMRPISINSVNREKKIMTLLYKVKGKGTKLMSELRAGDTAKILAPLGKGFPVIKNAARAALIGRGIGIAPLRFLAQDYAAQNTELYVYLSAKQENYLFNRKEFESLGAHVKTTINPSEKVTDFFAQDCENFKFDAAYSCGSQRLAKDMKALHLKYNFPAYVSLERHMACGVGACKGCICSARDKISHEEHYARVCKDGPVFDVDEVIS